MSSEATPPANNSPSPRRGLMERVGLAAAFVLVVGGSTHTWITWTEDSNSLVADFNGNARLTITGPHTVHLAENNGTKEFNFERWKDNPENNSDEMSAVLSTACKLHNKIKEKKLSDHIPTTAFMNDRRTALSFAPNCSASPQPPGSG